MQRVANTVEEDMIIKAIQEEATWEKLPKRLKLFLSSNEEWQRRVKEYCIKKRFKWSDCAARTTCKENEYYEDLMRYLRKNLALFPYHLAENVCRIQRITPFRYYCDMLYEVMKNERPYDSIPNFSAADALRLTGIGRNEFIDIMNKCRAKKLMWKLNKSIAKDMLPNYPVDFPIEPWWTVSIVNLSVEEFRRLTDDEMVVIDKVGKEEVNCVGELESEVIRGLYRRGLVWLEVPVYPDDHFQVSTLDGFVSNREQSYEDPTEELLYAVFVASSEQATVAELAQTLQADLSQLEAAVSLASRLGWAKKVMDPAALLTDLLIPGSPNSEGSLGDDGFGTALSVPPSPFQEGVSEADGDLTRAQAGVTRFALMVDANLTSYLMMGSLSPGLKGHAVTLYEAGKLGDSSVAGVCEDLRQVEGKKFEGELQQLADHAFSLRHALECLRSGGAGPVCHDPAETDFESPEKSAADFGDFQLGPSAISQGSSPELSRPSSSPEMYDDTSKSPDAHDISLSAFLDETSQPETESIAGDEHHDDRAASVDHASDATHVTSSSATIEALGRIKSRHRNSGRKCRVDVLRVESLQGLASGTIQRVLRRDYHVLVSMIPLLSPPSVVSPDGVGPVHFGPPSRAAITPWMKLLLYSVAGSGPTSIALIKGQRLRLLPPPLAGCAKALLWAWDGVGVSGLGGRFEGSLVDGGVLLHCLNSLLKYSAVLVQPIPEACLDGNGTGNVVTKNIPLPLSERCCSPNIGSENEGADEDLPSSFLNRAAEELNLETSGFIRMVRIRKEFDAPAGGCQREVSWEWVPQSVEFGIPLFDTNLCKLVCEGIVRAELFQSPALSRHRDAMQKLRRKLQEFISDHQANGPISKLTYPGGQFKPGERPRLLSLASSKWSASDFMFDPVRSLGAESASAQPITRRRSEVVSIVGEPTRSPLPPVYEPANRFIEESSIGTPSSTDPKVDICEDDDGSDVPLPGVNLIFDGKKLMPLNIALFLQGRLPVALVAEAATASALLVAA